MENGNNNRLQEILNKLRGEESPEQPVEEPVVPEKQEEDPYLGPCGMKYPKCGGPYVPDEYKSYPHLIPKDVDQCDICTISSTYNPGLLPELPENEPMPGIDYSLGKDSEE